MPDVFLVASDHLFLPHDVFLELFYYASLLLNYLVHGFKLLDGLFCALVLVGCIGHTMNQVPQFFS